MNKYYLTLVLLFLFTSSYAQISAPAVAVAGTPVTLTTSRPGNTFVWAFDSIHVNSASTPAANPKRVLLNHASMQGGVSQVVHDSSNGRYYAFWGNWNGGTTIYRLDFGANPLSTPVVTTVSIAGMGFTGNDNGGMDLVWDAAEARWYLFWGGKDGTGSHLLRVNFGGSLANAPVSGGTMTFSQLGYPFQITAKKYGNEWLLFSASNWGLVARFDFGTSLSNTPSVTALPNPVSIDRAGNFSLIEQGGEWSMILTTTTAVKAFRYDFGADLKNNTPTLTGPWTSIGVMKGITLFPNQQCRQQLFGYGVNESHQIIRFNFAGSVQNAPSITDLGGVFFSGRSFTANSIVYRDTVFMLSTEFNNKNLVAVPIIPLPAGSQIRHYNPSITHTFNTPGVHTITLMADPGNPAGPSTYCTTITVVEPVTQPARFTAAPPNACRNTSGIAYTVPAVSAATSYEWSYTGTGVTFSGGTSTSLPTNNVSFSAGATNGTLRVRAVNAGSASAYRDTLIAVSAIPDQPGTFTASASSVCQGQSTVAYTVPAVSGAVSYEWAYSGAGATFSGTTSTAAPANNISFSASATGGNVQVSARNTCGVSAVRGLAVTVGFVPAQPAAFTTSTTSVCRGQNNVTYTIPAVTGAASYEWSYTGAGATFAGGTSTTTPANNISFSGAATAGDLVVSAKSSCGTGSARTLAITVGAAPAQPGAFTAGLASVCQGQRGVAYAVPDVSGVTYTWSYQGGSGVTINGSGSSVTADFGAASTGGTIRVSATNSCGTSSIRELAVAVHTMPRVSVSPAGPLHLCAQDSIRLTVHGGSGFTHYWKNGMAAANGSDSVFTVRSTGSYSAVVANGNTGCKDSTQPVSVTVYDRPAGTVTPGDTSFCLGGSVRLNAITADTGLSYRWHKGGTPVPSATASFLEVAESGAYSIEMSRDVVPGGCQYMTTPVSVTVHPLPVPDISWDGQTLTTSGRYSSYQWHSDGQPVAGATDSSFQPPVRGGYGVEVTDTNGCAGRSAIYNVTLQMTDGVLRPVAVYPNPVRDLLRIRSDEPVHIALYAADGRLLIRQEYVRVIDMRPYPDGVYLLQVTSPDGADIHTGRVIKSAGY